MSNTPESSGEGEDERPIRTDTTVMATVNVWIMRRLTQTTLTGEVLEAKCHCRKTFKNVKGLKIHQSRIHHGKGEEQMQCMVATLSETQEECSQEAPHITGDLSASVQPQSCRRDSPNTTPVIHLMREKVKWPLATNISAWSQLDQEHDRVLEATLAETPRGKSTA